MYTLNANEKRVQQALNRAWQDATELGIVGGSYYDLEDVEQIADDLEIKLSNEQMRRALRRWHLFDVQDYDTLVDAIYEERG